MGYYYYMLMIQFVWDPEVFEKEWGVLAMSAGVKIGGMGCGKLPVPQCSDLMRPQVNPPPMSRRIAIRIA